MKVYNRRLFILFHPSVQVQIFHAILAGGRDLSCQSSLIGCNTKIIAGIFDMLNVACKPLQQLKTLAVGLFYSILFYCTTSVQVKI